MPTLTQRIQKAWNAFRNKDPTPQNYTYFGYGSAYRPDRLTHRPANDRSIITPILTRIAVDAAAIDIRHVHVDGEGRYKDEIKDSMNDLFTLEANCDQTARDFRKDVFYSLLEEGSIAVCPIDADVNYHTMTIDKFGSVRVGRITAWYPKEIEVELYNEKTGQKQSARLPKALCLILQNPFWEIMNAPNSVLARLRKKLALLDKIDEETASGKLDMIIQLPYSTRHETNRERADQRKKDIEMQLNGSRYGIAYIDASEKVIQLSKSLDNKLQEQIKDLEKQLLDQLGMCSELLNNTADEKTHTNYMYGILEPLVSVFKDETNRKWLTPNARSRGESVMFFRNPLRFITLDKVAALGDSLLRNQILTSNDMRTVLGFKPLSQPGADILQNPNMPVDMTFTGQNPPVDVETDTGGDTQDEYTEPEAVSEEEEYPAEELPPDG